MDSVKKISTEILLSIIGGLGLALVFWPEEWAPAWFSQLPTILHSISHALIIAAVLGFTVDKVTKERLVKETAGDLVEHLIGYTLPNEIKEHIRAVVTSTVVRMNFELRCELIPLDNKRMTVKAELSYYLRNFSNEDKEYTPYLGLEDSYCPNYESISVHHVEETGYCRTIDGTGENRLEVKSKLPGHTYIVGDPLMVKAAPVVEKRPPYTVTLKYSLLMTDNNMYVETLVAPTMNIIIKVNCPLGYEVRVGTGKPTPESSGGYWEYKKLFIQGEYIGIRWFPIIQANSPTISSSVQT